MASLSAHLTAGGGVHARLRFHPDCPRCRTQRLSGTLAADQLLSQRAQATIAAGLLALAGAGPPAALAAEPDQEQEGSAAPVVGGGDTADDPGLDPGGEDTTLKSETEPVASAPEAGGDEDSGSGGPVESEPGDDPDGRLVLTEPPDPELPVTTTPALPGPAPAMPTETPSPIPPGADVNQRAPRAAPGRSGKRKAPKRTVKLGQHVTHPTPGERFISPAPVETAASSEQVTTVAAPRSAPTAADPVSDPRYKVRPGDSLWSIARHLLGSDASAGQVAREVNRLWELNQEQIGTGNPSLIHVATVLRLR